MIRLGSLILDGETPRIAVSFGAGISDQRIAEAQYKGIDIAELRIDQFDSRDPEQVVREARRFSKFPIIATIRSKSEGGHWSGSEPERLQLFKKVIPVVDAVDIELSSGVILDEVIREARSQKTVTIVSYHNFDRTPALEELHDIVARARERGGNIVKIATMSKTRKDIQLLGDLTLQNADKNIVSIAMGKHGAMSRVMFHGLGSLFTFASMGQPSAPGQMTFDETVELLKEFYPDYKEE